MSLGATASPVVQDVIALGPLLVVWPAALDLAIATAAAPRIVAAAAARDALVPRVSVRSDATIEELEALDADGCTRIRLVRLPDSDYYGWERLCQRARGYVESTDAAPARAAAGPPRLRRACPVTRWRAATARFVCLDCDLALCWSRRCSVAALRVIDALQRGDEVRLCL